MSSSTNEQRQKLISNFNSNYLSSLKTLLDDKEFHKNCSFLPKINTNSKENQGFKSKSIKERKLIRTIIYDYILKDQSNQSNQSNNETDKEKDNDFDVDFRYKITNPIKTYLFDKNEKLKKLAFDQILNEIINNPIKKEDSKETKENQSDFMKIYNELDFYMKSLSFQSMNQFENENENENEIHLQIMKNFDQQCEINGIISVNQRIDYYLYMRNLYMVRLKEKDFGTRLKYANKAKMRLSIDVINKEKDKENDKDSLIDSVNSIIITNKTNKTNKTKSNQALSIKKDYKSLLNTNKQDKSQDKPQDKSLKYKLFLIETQSKLSNLTNDTQKSIKSTIKEIEIYINNINQSTKPEFEKTTPTEKVKFIRNVYEISYEIVIIRNIKLNIDVFHQLLQSDLMNFLHLKYLNISNTCLLDDDLSNLLSILEQFSKGIEYLNISYIPLSKRSNDVLIRLISNRNTRIILLNLSFCSVTDSIFSSFSVGLSKNSSLSQLNLSGNKLKRLSAVVLGTIIRYDKKLTCLDISYNQFEEEDLNYIFKGLISNTSLLVLYIKNMKISNKTLLGLSSVLTINHGLKEVYIDNNLLTNKCCETIRSILLKNKRIELISVSGNRINNDGIDYLLDFYMNNTFILEESLHVQSVKEMSLFKVSTLNEYALLVEYYAYLV